MHPAIFLDRDGIIIEGELHSAAGRSRNSKPGAVAALHDLKARRLSFSFGLQSVRSRPGLFALLIVEKVNEHIRQEFGRKGVKI